MKTDIINIQINNLYVGPDLEFWYSGSDHGGILDIPVF